MKVTLPVPLRAWSHNSTTLNQWFRCLLALKPPERYYLYVTGRFSWVSVPRQCPSSLLSSFVGCGPPLAPKKKKNEKNNFKPEDIFDGRVFTRYRWARVSNLAFPYELRRNGGRKFSFCWYFLSPIINRRVLREMTRRSLSMEPNYLSISSVAQ